MGAAIGALFTCIGKFLDTFFTQVFGSIALSFKQFGACVEDFFTEEIGNCISSWFGSEDCCCTPNSCNQFASGSAYTNVSWGDITTGFTDCVDNITFNVSNKRYALPMDPVERYTTSTGYNYLMPDDEITGVYTYIPLMGDLAKMQQRRYKFLTSNFNATGFFFQKPGSASNDNNNNKRE